MKSFDSNLQSANQKKLNHLNNYQDWLQDKNFTKETIDNYLATINQYGKREMNAISISSFFREILSKYQPATIRSKRNALTSYAKFLKINIDWERIKRILPTEQRKHFPTVTCEELERLKAVNTHTDKLTNERNNIILDCFWYLGIRVNELINIRHSDYCQGDLRIHGKGNKFRYLPLPPFLIHHFNPHSRHYLFLSRSGKKLTKGQIRRNIKKKAQLAGINKNISPHSFRRSLATNSYNIGIRLDTIQKQLGHTNLNTTLTYIHNDYQTFYSDCSKLWMNQSLTS